MGKPRRKKGKNARRARQGRLGLLKTASNGSISKQFEKLRQVRENKKHKIKDAEKVEELVQEQLSRGNKDAQNNPFVFVVHSGIVGKYICRLEKDVRRIFCPFTSLDLRVTKKNTLKDFLVHTQFLGVSHLVVLSKTEKSVNLKVIRNPQGPTLHFRVESYSLMRDLQSIQKKTMNLKDTFLNPPLVILNGFTHSEKRLNLVKNFIQHMFPVMDVNKVKLKSLRRTLLANYNAETDTIDFRHYLIKAVPSGISKSAKKLMQNKVPDLSKYRDFSEFLLNPGAISDSEHEEEPMEITLSQDLNSRGLMSGQSTKIRLIEIGPRMTWKLTKVEEGVNKGEVLYQLKQNA